MPALCVPSVSTPPGAIALTRIFRGPSSAASPRVIASSAPFQGAGIIAAFRRRCAAGAPFFLCGLL